MPNPMMRSLYKSADMEEDLPITLEPMNGFKSLKFAAEMTKNCCRKIDAKMPKISCRSAQKPGFRHMRAHFGLVFHALYNDGSTVQII